MIKTVSTAESSSGNLSTTSVAATGEHATPSSVTSSSATSVGENTSVASTSTVTNPSTTITSAPPISTSPVSSLLHPNGNAQKCLDVRGGIFQNGTPVQVFDCNNTPAQNWNIVLGQGHVQLAWTGFCLDAGSNPANGVGMKIWQCFDNLPAQDWFYTADDRVALTNQGFCLDLTDGNIANANQIQIWKCTDNDVNQVWTTSPGGSINDTSTLTSTLSTPTASSSFSASLDI